MFSIRFLKTKGSCDPFDFLGVALRPTMSEVTSGYSMSKKWLLTRSSLLVWVWIWRLWQSAKNWWLSHLKATMTIREHHWDKPLAMTLRSDLMNTHLSKSGNPSNQSKGCRGTSLEPMEVRASQFRFEFSHLWLNVSRFRSETRRSRSSIAFGWTRVSHFWSKMRVLHFLAQH